MGAFTSEQCEAIAAQYQGLSAAVFRKRLAFIHTGFPASDPALIRLQSQQVSLGDISAECALKAANLTLDNAESAAARISSSLESAKSAMHTLEKVDRAISIASDAIILSVAIFTGNFDQIAAAAKTLQEVSA